MVYVRSISCNVNTCHNADLLMPGVTKKRHPNCRHTDADRISKSKTTKGRQRDVRKSKRQLIKTQKQSFTSAKNSSNTG